MKYVNSKSFYDSADFGSFSDEIVKASKLKFDSNNVAVYNPTDDSWLNINLSFARKLHSPLDEPKVFNVIYANWSGKEVIVDLSDGYSYRFSGSGSLFDDYEPTNWM